MCEYTVIKCHLMLIVFGLYSLIKKKKTKVMKVNQRRVTNP